MIRPSRQPCSLLTGDDSLAPAATACRTIRSGSSTTSSVRLVAPSIARGLSRFMAADVAATQNAASPTPRCDDVFPLADTMKDGCAERCFVERDRFTRGLDPQLGLDTRHRASLRSTTPHDLCTERGSTGNLLVSCRLRKSVAQTNQRDEPLQVRRHGSSC